MAERGSILVITAALAILLISLAGGFLYATGVLIGNSGWEETDAQVFWLAEAGMQKGIWNLKTPTGSGGQGENWTTVGTTENLSGGSYTMVVSRYDFALAANGGSASANSSNGANVPANAIDNNAATFWESGSVPSGAAPQFITITFPNTLTINKVRFVSPAAANRPRDYTWQVSTNGSAFTTVVTVIGNAVTDVTNTFNAQSSVNFLRLQVTRPGTAGNRVRVSTLEAIGSKITSTGTITVSGNNYTRSVQGTVVTDDASPQNQVAYKEPDWIEL